MSSNSSVNKPQVYVARGAALEYLAASHENPANPGALKKVLFNSASLPSGKLQMVNWARIPADKGFQRHYHEDMHEIFVIISGKAEMLVANDRHELESGDAILIPPNTVHSMTALLGDAVDYIVFGVSLEQGGKTVVIS